MSNFFEILKAELADYDGPYEDLISWAPRFVEFFGSMLEDTRVLRPARQLINSALGYFVLPFDVLPETSMGGFGYLDDLYLCAYVAHLLQCEPAFAELLDEHWAYDRPLGAVVGEVLATTAKALSADDRAQVLFFSGLSETGAPAR